MNVRYWIFCYDISHPRRLAKIARLALKNGERVQKSLYLCPMTREQVVAMVQHIQALTSPRDRVLLRPVCRICHRRTRDQGAGGHPERREPFWVV